MSFFDILSQYNWQTVTSEIYSTTNREVEAALSGRKYSMSKIKALLSPAAEPYLEEMARQSQLATRQYFGNIIQLYAPIYLSNHCQNSCVYCGFKAENKISRKVLTDDEIKQELETIGSNPFNHILLVTGESNKHADIGYLQNALKLACDRFQQVSIEVQPLSTKDYATLGDGGLHGVYIYQETYHPDNYKNYHLKGAKSDFKYRLETPDRIGEAGIRKIGLGNLIGLEDWRTEAYFTALHINYLHKNFWQSKLSVSLPRLRPFTGDGFQPNFTTSERNLLQLICAYRLFDNQLDISLSTRESAAFRNNVMALGVTAMSAGSKTEPGGYNGSKAVEQFAINDNRQPLEVADAIRLRGFEPVWKDWDNSFNCTVLKN